MSTQGCFCHQNGLHENLEYICADTGPQQQLYQKELLGKVIPLFWKKEQVLLLQGSFECGYIVLLAALQFMSLIPDLGHEENRGLRL